MGACMGKAEEPKPNASVDKNEALESKPSAKSYGSTHSSIPVNTNEFPYKLGPFGICKSHLSSVHFSHISCHENATGAYQIDPRRFKSHNFKLLNEFINNDKHNINAYGFVGNVSPLHPVTLDAKAKVEANIPVNAKHFSWSYPSILPKKIFENSNKENISNWLSDPNIILLTVGGYMYFDKNKKLLQINTLIPAIDGGLQFSKPKKWDNNFTMSLHKDGRFQEITIAALSEKGAKYFCWLFPMEEIKNEKFEKRIFTKHGGFVYLFHEPGDMTDENAVKMDRYFEVLDGNEFNASNKKQQLLLKQGKIKDIDDEHRKWKLTFVEYKKKELEALKSQLQDLQVIDADDEEVDDVKDGNDVDNGKMVKNWDENKVVEWLNDIKMNELKLGFYRKGVNGQVLLNSADVGGNGRGNDNGKLFADLIKDLSKSELEAIVMRQFEDRLNGLRESEMNKEEDDKELILRNKINELQMEIESIQDSKICLICYVNNKNILIKPCNHCCCCDICIKEIENCPLCDKRILSTEKIYN